jgi:ABC-type oligopeptide transport system substrate-binding subunit
VSLTRLLKVFGALIASTAIANAGDPKILRIASREAPSRLNPLRPLGDIDRRALDLVFEPLLATEPSRDGGIQYRPALAEAVPFGQGTHPTFKIRPGAKWSDSTPITADDVRHSLRLVRDNPNSPLAWRSLMDAPQSGSAADEIRIPLRRGLIDPKELFTFPILPQLFQGRQLELGEVKDFSQSPLGSGPFVVAGRIQEGPNEGVRFRKNPHHPAATTIPFDEIHWFAVKDPAAMAKLRPDITLGLPTLPGLGDPQTHLTRRIWTVALNQRNPALADIDVRRFLAHSLDRKVLPGVTDKTMASALLPNDSWARAAAARVPLDLHQPEIAAALASKIAMTRKTIALSLKFPGEHSDRVARIAEQWQAAAKAKGLELSISLVPLSGLDLADAVARHDYDLALVSEDHGDSPARLMALFDTAADALKPGGSNYLGARDDAILIGQIDDLTRSRQFPSMQSKMHNLHVHLFQTMPIIPMWRHEELVSIPGRRPTAFDPLRPFANIGAWAK